MTDVLSFSNLKPGDNYICPVCQSPLREDKTFPHNWCCHDKTVYHAFSFYIPNEGEEDPDIYATDLHCYLMRNGKLYEFALHFKDGYVDLHIWNTTSPNGPSPEYLSPEYLIFDDVIWDFDFDQAQTLEDLLLLMDTYLLFS